MSVNVSFESDRFFFRLTPTLQYFPPRSYILFYKSLAWLPSSKKQLSSLLCLTLLQGNRSRQQRYFFSIVQVVSTSPYSPFALDNFCCTSLSCLALPYAHVIFTIHFLWQFCAISLWDNKRTNYRYCQPPTWKARSLGILYPLTLRNDIFTRIHVRLVFFLHPVFSKMATNTRHTIIKFVFSKANSTLYYSDSTTVPSLFDISSCTIRSPSNSFTTRKKVEIVHAKSVLLHL